jgi:two-component system C4-dicarboxylate transport sensor histidine kinase DctB
VLDLLQKRLGGVQLELTLAQRTEEGAPAVRRRLDPRADATPIVAYCDELRLEQVLINLVGNALDAVAATTAPRIAIDVEVADTTVEITVSDNGPGIPADALPRLFEPFFTTKEVGQGLGLGLAIASSITRDCGGTLVARNEANGGAAFVLTLRRAGAVSLETDASLP